MPCSCCHQGVASFVPTTIVMERLAELSGCDVGDPLASELFDPLVLRGCLKPWIPDCWEKNRWAEAEKLVRR